MQSRLSTIGLAATLTIITSASCTTLQHTQESAPASASPSDALPNENGFSGLAQVDDSAFLAVHDELIYEDGSRLTLIRMETGMAPTFSPVRVDDWMDPSGPSSDLESICAVPSRFGHFLLAEAGYWESQYGRLFHIELDAQEESAKVLGVAQLPLILDNDPNQDGDQFEGLECTHAGDDSILLVLGERGGSDSYRSGRLRWGTLDLTNHSLTFTSQGKQGVELNAPGQWSDASTNRDISALYVDPEGTLWAAAAEDPGDLGPFHSVIYKVGVFRADPENPIQINQTIDVWKEVPGFKIEALSGPLAAVAGSTLSFGTEDELYGGVLRFL
ncbi:MAG: hypothetical protein F4060_05315 [Holophagales bacterium]|nr:hypothetical protein [Holophagales bacterium]MYG31071.1 hypothetical protein [Holophagales bacterium]MYI79340.1 hypothetical protein [Holophagales bacterium]